MLKGSPGCQEDEEPSYSTTHFSRQKRSEINRKETKQFITSEFNQNSVNSSAFAQNYMGIFLLSALSVSFYLLWLYHNILGALMAEATRLQQPTSQRWVISFATVKTFHHCSGDQSIKNTLMCQVPYKDIKITALFDG